MADVMTSDLGAVTAYADAKAQGFTGTREEFGKLLTAAANGIIETKTMSVYAVTVPTSWVQSGSEYYVDIAVNGVTEVTQMVNVLCTGTTAAEVEAAGTWKDYECLDGKIRLYSGTAIDTEFGLQFWGVG